MTEESSLKARDKEVAVPGEVLATGMQWIPSFGTYRKQENVIANRLGLVTIEGKVIRTIPLSGKYIPKRNDVIIGKVADILMSGWLVEINTAYNAVLGLKDATFEFINKGEDLTRFYNLEDYIVAKIINVTSQNLIDLTMKGPGLRRLRGGQVIQVNTHKVPRIIGKKGSMVQMIKMVTGCKIIVGQNGLVWIEGTPEQAFMAIQAIKKIEDESHIPGLTDRMKVHLEQVSGKKIDEAALQQLQQHDESAMSQEEGERPRFEQRFDDGGRGHFQGEGRFQRGGMGHESGGRFPPRRRFDDGGGRSFDRPLDRRPRPDSRQGGFEQGGHSAPPRQNAPQASHDGHEGHAGHAHPHHSDAAAGSGSNDKKGEQNDIQ